MVAITCWAPNYPREICACSRPARPLATVRQTRRGKLSRVFSRHPRRKGRSVREKNEAMDLTLRAGKPTSPATSKDTTAERVWRNRNKLRGRQDKRLFNILNRLLPIRVRAEGAGQRFPGVIITATYAARSGHKTWALRNRHATWSRRDGRSLPRPRHPAGAYGRDQDPARAVLFGSGSQAAVRARGQDHLRAESSAHLRAV